MAGEKSENQKKIVSIKVKLLGIILPVVIVIMILLVGILYYISKISLRSTRKICWGHRSRTRPTRSRRGWTRTCQRFAR